jgi:hypothetical protein
MGQQRRNPKAQDMFKNVNHYKTGHGSNLIQTQKQDPQEITQTPKVSTAVLNVDGAALPLAVGKPKLGPVPGGKGLVPVWV